LGSFQDDLVVGREIGGRRMERVSYDKEMEACPD